MEVGGAPSLGGGVGWPFLNDEVVEGLLLGFMGREVGVEVDAGFVLCSLSAGRWRVSVEGAFRLGGLGRELELVLGSPVIWARRSPICAIILVDYTPYT